MEIIVEVTGVRPNLKLCQIISNHDNILLLSNSLVLDSKLECK